MAVEKSIKKERGEAHRMLKESPTRNASLRRKNVHTMLRDFNLYQEERKREIKRKIDVFLQQQRELVPQLKALLEEVNAANIGNTNAIISGIQRQQAETTRGLSEVIHSFQKEHAQSITNLAVVTLPFSDLAGEAILGNYIDLLEPLANEIYVITGKFSDRPNEKTHIIRVGADVGKKEPMLIKIPRFLLTQAKYCYHLFKVSRKVDVVIFQIGTRLYLLPILLAKLLRKKVVIVATGRVSISAKTEFGKALRGVGGLIFPLIFRTLENITFSLADQITVLSKSGINTLDLSRYGKKTTISGAQYINTNTYRIKKELRDRKNLVGYIGNLGRRKGVLNFIKAIPLVLRERNDVEFLVGGSGPLADTIKQELGKNGLYSKVKLVGWISQEQLPDQLNELKLFILPSYVEGLPAIVQQAMACGAVVLATSVGGIPDLIKDGETDGETGFILEDNSPECIAKNVIRALNDPNIESITRNARALIENEYTYAATVANLRNTLRDLTGSDENR